MLARHLLELQDIKDADADKQFAHLSLQLMNAENALQDRAAQDIRILLRILETKATVTGFSFSLIFRHLWIISWSKCDDGNCWNCKNFFLHTN